MKKLIVTTVAIVACVSAFAQGKVSFGNDANHLFMVGSDPAHLTANYSSLVGQAMPQIGSAGPYTMGNFTAELWAGTSAGSLSLATSIAADGQAGFNNGRLGNHAVTLAGFPGGTVTFFQVRIWETAAGSWNATQTGAGRTEWLQGESPVFSAVPGAILPNSIVLPGAPSNSTWANGPMSAGTVDPVPEPSTLALAGLGAAALLIFRRRK